MSNSPEYLFPQTEAVHNLHTQLAETSAELTEHRSTMAYAFAMGSSCALNPNTPAEKAIREKDLYLLQRVSSLKAQLAEHEIPVE